MKNRAALLSALLLSLTLVHCGGSADEGAASGEEELRRDAGAVVEVKLGSMSFTPATLSVALGTTVRFHNVSGNTHTVTSGSGSAAANAGQAFDKVVQPGQSVSIKFTTVGVQPYFCRPHERMGMSGTVTVH